MLDNIKLSTQLGAGFGIILLLLTGLVWISTSVLNTTQNHLDQVVNDKNVKVSTVRGMLEHQLEINSRMRNLIFLDNDSDMQKEQREFYRQWEEYGVLFKKIDDMNLDAEDEQLVAEIMTQGKAAMAVNEEVLKPAMANKNEKAVEILMNQGVPANERWKSLLTNLAEHQQAASKQFADQAQADYQQALTLILALFGLVVVVSAGVAISVVRSVLGQLGGEPREVAEIARHIAAGDLNSEIQVKSGDSESIMAAMQQVQSALK
ncbi:MAG: MCP four helix bundle domain-containing protein, partial [Methylococcaceae bacterium]